MEDEPRSGKRDRLARLTRVVALLRAHPDGMTTQEIAGRIGVSVRTVYRDLNAIEGEIDIPFWSEGGKWGLGGGGVPAAAEVHARRGDGGRPVGPVDGPLRRQVRPRPRLGVREAGRGPAPGAARARRADARRPVAPPARRAVQPPRPAADEGLGGAADRVARLRAGPLRAGLRAADGPSPAVPHRALAPDPRAVPRRVRRDARRDPDVQGRADPGHVGDAAIGSSRRRRASRGRSIGRGTSSPTRTRSRSSSASRRRSRRASRRPAGIPRSRSRSRPTGR